MFPKVDARKTGINLKKLMDRRGLTVKDVQKYLGLSTVQSIYHWLNGRCLPSVDNLYAMSELFQVPMDDLVCGNREECAPGNANERYRRLHIYCTKLNENRAA